MSAPGRCVYCGCTDEQGCDDGCSWADQTGTLCSICAIAEDIAGVFWTVLTQQLGAVGGVRDLVDLPLDQRLPLVIAGRLIVAKLRETLLGELPPECLGAVVEHAKLEQFLLARYPDAVAAIADDESCVDVALRLLGERRVVLAR